MKKNNIFFKLNNKIVLLYIFIISFLISGITIARYQTQLKNNTNIIASKWIFKLSYNDMEVKNADFDINMSDTITTNIKEVEDGYIAPGTAGVIPLKIDCTGCEVGVEYWFKLTDNNSTIPEQLQFFMNEDYNAESRIFLNSKYTFYLNLNEVSNIQNKNIYWKWIPVDNETVNEKDIEKSGTTMVVSIVVAGEQMLQKNIADEGYFRLSGTGVLTVKPEKVIQFNNETNVIVPTKISGEDVKTIGAYAFSGFENLKNIVLQDNIIAIGEGAFARCKGLEEITLPNTISEIPDNAFLDCFNLQSIHIGSNINKIGKWAFENCTSLSNITIPKSVLTIGESAFYNCNSIVDLTLSNGITLIDKWTFWNCTKIVNLSIPDSVKEIREGAFGQCTDLLTIKFSEELQILGDSSFYRCSNLKEILLPDSVAKIENLSFGECISLTSAALPNGTIVSDTAFYGCGKLTN